MLFALISETRLLTGRDLFRLAEVVEMSVQHSSKAYGLELASVEVADDRKRLPPWAHPIVFVEGEGDPGANAVHFDDVRFGPVGLVYVDRASGLNDGPSSVIEQATHEAHEIRINPRANLWVPHPDPMKAHAGQQIAYENADPVQSTYAVEVRGTKWRCANFVTPFWFDGTFFDPTNAARLFAHGGRFDHAGQLQHAGQIGPEGYTMVRAFNIVLGKQKIWYETASFAAFVEAPARDMRERAAKVHPLARGRALKAKFG